MYNIIIPKDASACERFAAQELKDFVFKATDVELQIATESEMRPDEFCFSVGKTRLLSEHGITPELKSLKYDGFILKTVGNIFFIAGARERGTLYGVYEYLERELGVRFISDDCTHIPKGAFKFPQLDMAMIPEFELRSFFCQHIRDDELFSARMRMVALWGKEREELGYGLQYDFFDTVHNTLDLLPPEIYYREHPEFFAHIPDRPIESDDIRKQAREICFSNGIKDDGGLDESKQISGVKVVIESIKNLAEQYPSARYFMIGQQDSVDNYCRCEKCSGIYNKYGAQSAALIRFCNVVAREIKKWADREQNGREINIVTFAYSFSEKPPVVKDEKGQYRAPDSQVMFEDNLCIRIAAADANYVYSLDDPSQISCKDSSSYPEIFRGWSALTKKIMVWDYNSNFMEFLWYFPNLRVIKKNLEFYKKLGVIYVFNEASVQDLWQTRLKCYLAKNLMWNLSADTDSLIKEFCDIYYGYASENVLKVIGLYENRVTQLISTDEGRLLAHNYINKNKNLFQGVNTENIAFGAHMYLAYWALDLYHEFFPASLLEEMVATIKEAIDMAQKRGGEEDNVLIRRLAAVILTPMRMLQLNFSEYYMDRDKKAFDREFLYYCELAGQQSIGLNIHINELNKTFGEDLKKMKEALNEQLA